VARLLGLLGFKATGSGESGMRVGRGTRRLVGDSAHCKIAGGAADGSRGKGHTDLAGRRLDEALAARLPSGDRPVSEARVSVVIPALNEAENLPAVLPKIDASVHEILLVDGNSTDGTARVAEALHPQVRVVRQVGLGKGAALRSGFAEATGDIVVMLDADGSTDPAEIPAFIGALLGGADYAKGSRFLQGAGTLDMPWYRRLGNWFFVVVVRFLFGGRYSDLCYGYNACWADVLPRIEPDVDGFEIETMMNIRALRARLKIVEVASFESVRLHGDSHLKTFPDGWRVLRTIVRERFTPLAELRSEPIASAEAAEALSGGE
jgi:hypothetical protein